MNKNSQQKIRFFCTESYSDATTNKVLFTRGRDYRMTKLGVDFIILIDNFWNETQLPNEIWKKVFAQTPEKGDKKIITIN